MIRLDNISKHNGHRVIFIEASAALQKGEKIGLVGPNGVGKSTILSALAGRARVFSGELGLQPGLRVGLQTQQTPPFESLPVSGQDLLALTGATTIGLPSWLQDKLDQRVDQLSGGQRHYLALWAVVKAPRQEVLLLDEPTNHLDVAGVKHLAGTIRELAAQGLAILVVSHDEAFVDQVCDRIVLMEAPDDLG